MSSEQLPPPWKSGMGRAWQCDIDKLRKTLKVEREADATLGMWIVEAPWAHPFWHSYSLVLIHLRPLVPPVETKFYLPDATHEIWVYAMNADEPRAPAILGEARPAWLTPKNFAAQFIEPSDEAAIARIEATVGLILSGELNPDTDAASQWRALFGNNMVKEQYR